MFALHRSLAFTRLAVKGVQYKYKGMEYYIIYPRTPLTENLTSKILYSSMVDPKRVVSYEDMLKVIHQPEKVIIDVRNPDEVNSTGKIPSSINIPLGNVQDALATMSDEEFQKTFRRTKPSASDELIFYCRSGKRSTEALDKALKLGFNKSKTYLGSWNDWSSKQK
ncbi:rhodanese domain-containing protein CG4456-like [Maniola hyperantus]|uniref:rhodanese domain-containing protein CG4456-like n=1 Tax=Aphantopus hyperantus TaxID=2795564 RepID=UPI001569C3B6|nr:putative thiosulfate sulfurtransferase, mitochondrial isoform X1 [Maniola hyperantus]